MSFGLSWLWNSIDWIQDQLKSWNFVNKEATIIFVGLDNAGKTSLLTLLSKEIIS